MKAIILSELVGAISRCLYRLNYWWNKHSNQYYWFEVRYIYSDNGKPILNWVVVVGIRNKKTIANKREIKKMIQPLHENKRIANYMCNGDLEVETMCYLGRFADSR